MYGVIGFGLIAAIFPVYWLKYRSAQLSENDPYSKNMGVRGQYVNSSSSDVGPDPMAGKYIRRVYPAGKTIKSLSEVKAEQDELIRKYNQQTQHNQ